MRRFALVLIVLLLAACSKRYCAQDPQYMEAREYPPLKAPPGLSAPELDPNLAIPKPASRVFAKPAADVCLEVPPHLPAETAAPKTK